MHKTDHLKLDGKILQLFVTVHDTGSISATAELFSMNQSSVSHAMDKLRTIVGDPLFVKAGRGIAPTPRADALYLQAKSILSAMEIFVASPEYDPASDHLPFVIFATDYEVQTVVSPLMERMQLLAPGVDVRIRQTPSSGALAESLRRDEADLAISPSLHSGESDLKQQTLYEDVDVCYFDASCREAPCTLEQYQLATHVNVVLGSTRNREIDDLLRRQETTRRVGIECSTFASVATLVCGSGYIATLPARLSDNLFSVLDSCPPPVELAPFRIVQTWHERHTDSSRHQWFRRLVKSVSEAAPSNPDSTQ